MDNPKTNSTVHKTDSFVAASSYFDVNLRLERNQLLLNYYIATLRLLSN